MSSMYVRVRVCEKTSKVSDGAILNPWRSSRTIRKAYTDGYQYQRGNCLSA